MELSPDGGGRVEVRTGVPFLDHMLASLAFHGRFDLKIIATGDLEVDAHHVVEDVGLVMGDCLRQLVVVGGPIERFFHALVPMDDALAEVCLDVGGRPYLFYSADYPQPHVGAFDVALVREFLAALATRGQFNLHATVRYGLNSHHMVEALFKALGRALRGAYAAAPGAPGMSIKGGL